eukprot:5517864-Pyramimonas_sp.AAC.1
MDTVQLTIKTLLSHRNTLEFDSPVDSSRLLVTRLCRAVVPSLRIASSPQPLAIVLYNQRDLPKPVRGGLRFEW